MSLRTCDHCDEEFETITSCRLHESDCAELEDDDGGDDLEPDYRDAFAPERNSQREMLCLHCGETCTEDEIVYERRHGNPEPLWWCPTPGCDGAGVGFDLHPA